MEHNPLPGISSSVNVSGNTVRRFLGTTHTPRHKLSVDNVDTCLSDLMTVLRDSGVDINIMGQLLKQVMYSTCTLCVYCLVELFVNKLLSVCLYCMLEECFIPQLSNQSLACINCS